MLSVYWDAHDEAHLDIQRWRAGAERTPSLEAVERRLREVRGVAIYLESDPALFDRIRQLSDDLGAYVHTRGHRSSSAGLVPFTNIASFHAEAFDLWVRRVTEVVQFVLVIHLMKYPVGLQVTPLSEKFGLNPPAGGLVESERQAYREDLRQWAEQEGLATLEDVIARQRARIAERSAEEQ